MANDIVKSNGASKAPLIISIVALVGMMVGMYFMYNSFQKDLAVFKDKAAKYDTFEKDIADLKNQVADKDKQISAAMNLVEQHTKENARLSSENASLRAELNKPKPTVVESTPVNGEELVEKMVVSVLFNFNSFEITDNGKKELEKIAAFIKKYNSAVVIEGHADTQGDPDYNVWLSKRRADSVKEVLLLLSADKKPCDLIIIGVGCAKPISTYHQKNRRVTITAIQDCKDYIK